MAGATSQEPNDLEAQSDAPEKRASHCAFSSRGDEGGDNGHDNKEREREATEYGDTSAAYWKLYGSEAEIEDKKLIDSLRGDTESMLILNVLFSSIVASFIIEIYKTLGPNNGQPTQSPSQSSSSQNPNPQIFTPSNLAVRTNILMFLSLFFSMMGVLASTLIQQWCREYMRHAYPRAAPHKRGRVRTYLHQGLDQFQLRRFMYSVHVFLHVSVFLFFWALSDLLHNVDATVGAVARCCLWAAVAVYMALSISPLIINNSPYHTALTPPLRSGCRIIRILCRFISRSLRGVPIWPLTRGEYFKGIRFDRTHFLLAEADARAAQLDRDAMEWLFTDNDLNDINMDKYLKGLPGYFHSHLDFPKDLTSGYILTRIRGHFMTCATSLELSEEECMTRVQDCINSLRIILDTKQTLSDEEEELRDKYVRGIISGLNGLCDGTDPKVSLRASCVRGLAFHGFLTRLSEEEKSTEEVSPPTRKFPTHFVPLYKALFCLGGNLSGAQQVDSATLPPGAMPERSPMANDTEMWRALLYEGTLANLTLLAEAVLHHDIGPSNFSLCWKSLNLLLNGLGIARTEVPYDSALKWFKFTHDKVRKCVQTEERGFGFTRLLEILDAVSRGQRLSMVFSRHHKYHGRADVIFGKEYLRNANLLREFANCLPDFVSNNQDKSMEFMENLVREDGLWTSLQLSLWDALREDSPIQEKLSVFEACCTVLDQALLALEDSQTVDWRAPEFGSLGQHFEMFVERCFQGTFIGRATTFRIGIVKARFCKALLAKFFDEVDRNGTMVFRSQWDVASLARLFCTLGAGDEKDTEFWKSFVHGGHVEAGFVAKAHDMLKISVQDGPLLNFCKLGRLAVTMVPFEGSGLNNLDVTNLLKLLQNMIDDSGLPLKGACAEVWEDLSRLRGEVNHDISKSCEEDKVKLQLLSKKIEQVYDQRPSASQESGPETSAIVQPWLSFPEPRPHPNRSSGFSGYSSTVVAEGRDEAFPTKDNYFRESATYEDPDPPRNTLAHHHHSDSEHAIHHSASDPYHADSIGFGEVFGGLSADAAYNPPPLPGNVPLESQGISPVPPSFQHIRQNIHFVNAYSRNNIQGGRATWSPTALPTADTVTGIF